MLDKTQKPTRRVRYKYVLVAQYWRKPLALLGAIFASWGMMLTLIEVYGATPDGTLAKTHPLTFLALIWMSLGLFRYHWGMRITRLRYAVSSAFFMIALFYVSRGAFDMGEAPQQVSRFGQMGPDTALILMMLFACLLTRRNFGRLSLGLLLAAATLVLNAVVGQSYSLTFFGGHMSQMTMLALLFNTLAVVTVFAHRPLVRVLFLADEIGLRTRRMMTAGLMVPWFAGGLLVRTIPMSVHHALIASIIIAVIIWCMAAMAIYSGYMQDKSDAVRRVAERRLHAMATQDALTGVLNRAGLTQEIERSWEQFQNGESASGVILLDLDHFKRINDTYGHDEGDRILSEMGRAIRPHLRKGDTMGRWGGEEFVVLLSDVWMTDVFAVAERLRAQVQGIATSILAGRDCGAGPALPDYQTSASFGVSQFRPGDSSMFDAIKRADLALYRAKSEGRNRVVIDRDLAA